MRQALPIFITHVANAAYRMDYSENWLRFCKAEDNYFTCRYEVMQDKGTMVNDLEKALLGANHRESALRLLAELKPEIILVAPLLPLLVDTAVDSSHLNMISLSREVLFIYKDELETRNIIRNTADTYLTDSDEWHFRRTAELYKLLGYEAELTNLLALCRASSDAEIQALSKEY